MTTTTTRRHPSPFDEILGAPPPHQDEPLTSRFILDAVGPDTPPTAQLAVEVDRPLPPAADRHYASPPVNTTQIAVRVAFLAVLTGLALTLAGMLAGIGPGAAPKAHAADRAATVDGLSFTISATVNGAYGGMPHACVHNNGPDTIRTAYNQIRDNTHTLWHAPRTIPAGGTDCWSHGWVAAFGATYRVGVVDQRTGRYGTASVPVATGYAVRLQSTNVAAVQAAVGAGTDGVWGSGTDAAVNALRAAAHGNYGVRVGAVEAFQRAVGVGDDGDWGPITDNAWSNARNASYRRS